MTTMEKWARINYHPVLPLGENNSLVTSCKEHIELSRKAAEEGIVLLKNNKKALPLKKGEKIAIFGVAQLNYFRVGRGSGIIYSRYEINVYDGLKSKENLVSIYEPLAEFYRNYFTDQLAQGVLKKNMKEPEIPVELVESASEHADTAIITISRSSSEGKDRYNDGTDDYFNLSAGEKAMVEAACNNFDKVIVLLNVGAVCE